MDNLILNKNNSENISNNSNYRIKILWRSVFLHLISHIGAIYGLYCIIFFVQWKTIIFAYVVGVIAILGDTAGAHRLWSHRAYKAKLPLRIILVIFQTVGFHYSIYTWASSHRVHHKFTDTNADPYNSTRGFFFSHIGWQLVEEHENFTSKMKSIDLSDLKADSLVMFQYRYYVILVIIFFFEIVPVTPWYFWEEYFHVSLSVVGFFRFVCTVHIIGLINSAAHMWGTKPYDRNISPTENLITTALSLGEAFHNYHHTFPWDYKAAELGNYKFNFTTAFIDFMSKIGWAYDLKTVPEELIKKKVKKTGDGTRKFDDTLYKIPHSIFKQN